MDNLTGCHVEGVRERIGGAGAALLYLPPYSSDFNPIELCFAKPNPLLRAARRRTLEKLWATVALYLECFSATECRNSLRHCGYASATQS